MAVTNTFGSVIYPRPPWTYDSGSVAAGAIIESPVLPLSAVSELLVVIDNSAGAVFRDLTLTSYLDDGSTEIDSVVLRKVAFGAAPTGSVYAPGKVRGTIGPRVTSGPSGVHVLYDATSAADAAADSGMLSTEDMTHVVAGSIGSGGTHTLATLGRDDAGVAIYPNGATAAAALNCANMVGPGSGPGAGAGTICAGAVPRRLRFLTGTSGAGNTTRLIVYGRGPVPGTFAVAMALPTKAKFTLAAVGAQAARMTIIAR